MGVRWTIPLGIALLFVGLLLEGYGIVQGAQYSPPVTAWVGMLVALALAGAGVAVMLLGVLGRSPEARR